MQLYSAWRGFCNQVWGRDAVQLKAWEMEEAREVLPSPRMSICDNDEEKAIGSIHQSKHNADNNAPESLHNPASTRSAPHLLTINVPSINAMKKTSQAKMENQSGGPSRAPWEDVELCSPISSEGIYLPYQFNNHQEHEPGCDSEWPESPTTPSSSAPLRQTFASAPRTSSDRGHSLIAPFAIPATTSHSSPSRPIDQRQRRRSGTMGTEFTTSSSISLATHRSVHRDALGLPPGMEQDPRPSMAFTSEGGSPRASSSFPRPPVFGPEKIVEDERIKEVHALIMRDIWWVGGIAVVVSL
jgi:hypothetical protein